MRITESSPYKTAPKIVFFDLCQTLIDSKKIDHAAINYTLSLYGKDPWPITRQKKDPLKSMKENFPNFFEDKAKEAYDTYLNYLIKEINNIPVFDYAYEHLKALHELKAKTIVITNRDIKFIDALDSNKKFKKILPHVSNIITADEIGSTKPSPKVINYVLNKLNLKNIKNEEIVFVGDSLADMNTALLYPCVPILLTETSSDITEEFLSENKNKIYVANTHKEIYEAIKKISE